MGDLSKVCVTLAGLIEAETGLAMLFASGPMVGHQPHATADLQFFEELPWFVRARLLVRSPCPRLANMPRDSIYRVIGASL